MHDFLKFNGLSDADCGKLLDNLEFMRIVDASGHGIAIASGDFTLQAANKLFEDFFCVQTESVLGKKLCKILSEVTPEKIRQKIDNEVHKQGFISFNIKSSVKNGMKRPVSVYIYPVKNNEQTEISKWVIVAREFGVFGDKKTSIIKRNKELADSLSDIIIETDANLNILFMNRSGYRFLGYSSADLENGLTFFNLIPKNEWDDAVKLVSELENNDFSKPAEFIMLKKDGSSSTGEILLNAIRDKETQICGFSGVIRDISSRREIDEKNRLNTQIFSSIRDAIIVTDLNFNISDCNTTAEEIIGLGRDDILKKEVFGIFNFEPDFSGTQEEFVEQLWNQGSFKIIISFTKPDNNKKWLEVRIFELNSQDYSRLGWIFLASDITESKLLEDSLRTKNARMEAFAYTISHDLVSPLTGIEGFTGLLASKMQDKLDDESALFLKRVKESSARMKKMIRNIYKIFKLGLNRSDLENVNIPSLLKSIEESIHLCDSNRETIVRYEGLENIFTSEVLLKELLYNLIDNGLKYNRSEVPTVEVMSFNNEQKGEIVFSVKDNGIGISSKDHDKVFVLFQRLKTGMGDSKNFSGDSGTGAGLAICKTIIEELGGSIKVESTGVAGEGSDFRFSFPANPAYYHFTSHTPVC